MKEYIISCNVKKFDVISFVNEHRTLYWKQSKAVNPGDVIYIYVGVPYCRLYYRCVVLQSDLDSCPETMSYYLDNKAKRYMKLGNIKVLPEEGLYLQNLMDNGVKTVQCSTEVSQEFHEYLSAVLKGDQQ